ncbi:TIGR01244 family phosphatase, partial [Escherichia coli]|nr:TIGR01244 family phosphatase [Escherichia coli]
MEIRQIEPSFAAAPQIKVEDVAAIAQAGYRSLMCNRPDGEADDQTPAGEIAAAAREAGLEFRFVPIKPGVISDEVIETFDEALKGCKGPILAYCRTGTRSS